MRWRIELQADDIGCFALEIGIMAGRCGCRPPVRQIRCTTSLLIPNSFANLRQDQWVEASPGLRRVAGNTLACSCGDHARLLTRMPFLQQAIHALFQETLPPF